MTLFDQLSERLERGHNRPVEEDILLEALHVDAATLIPAAVLVPVVDKPEPTVILTHRPTTMRNHAGQVAFPGGKIDPGDKDAIAAALRETEEEMGIPAEHVRIVGATDTYLANSGFAITPVLGILPEDIVIEPNPIEVADWFEVPMDFLFDRRNRVRQALHWQGRDRHFYEIMWQNNRIWGVTAGIVAKLSVRLDWVDA